MKLNQTNAYAIAAMIHVAKLPPGTLARGQEIADSAKMPPRYLFQVLTGVGHGKVRHPGMMFK